MPEAPEYLKLRGQIAPAWTGNRVSHFTAPIGSPNPRKYIQGDWKDFAAKVTKAPIQRVEQQGKALLLTLKTGHIWQIHLSSTGWLLPGNDAAKRRSTTDPIHANFIHSIHDGNVRVRIHFSDGQTWNYHDPRTWGKWWLREPGWTPLGAGPDWLREPLEAELALTKHRSKRTAKDVLCDQRVTSGLGNYLSCETLWRAGIHPHTRWDQVPEDHRRHLARTIRSFLRQCEAAPDHSHWAVFTKKGQPCRRHPDQPILYAKDGAGAKRGSYYCPLCQGIV